MATAKKSAKSERKTSAMPVQQKLRKQLLLVRHAKSSWGITGLADPLRPLSARGYRQGGQLAERLPVQPEHWLCSDAIRTYSTALLLKAQPLTLSSELYLAEPETLLAHIDALPELTHCVGMIGHNPGLEALVFTLTGQEIRLKTCEMALLEWQGDWTQRPSIQLSLFPRVKTPK